MEGAAEPDTPVPGRSATDRAAALARLLHRDCTRLLELYKERESLTAHPQPEGERLLSLSLCEALSPRQRVGHLRSALSRCMELLECVIRREVEEMGEEMEGEYESLRRAVRDRLGHLLLSTAALLENAEGGDCPAVPQRHCTEGQDEVEGSGGFAAKLWTYRVLLELIHWTDSTSQTLHLIHSETQSQQLL